LGTDFLNAKNHVENAKEGDDKILSLWMCMPPQEEEEKEEQVEEEWSSYPSPTPRNGNEHILTNDDLSLSSSPLCGTIMTNIWEDESDIIELDDPLCSLHDNSLCGECIQNYEIKFTFDACNYYERGRDKSPLYISMSFKMQATDHYMHYLPLSCCYLFIYETPMHRKRVRLKSKWFNVLWCVPYALISY
jgi:hypothetical protein